MWKCGYGGNPYQQLFLYNQVVCPIQVGVICWVLALLPSMDPERIKRAFQPTSGFGIPVPQDAAMVMLSAYCWNMPMWTSPTTKVGDFSSICFFFSEYLL